MKVDRSSLSPGRRRPSLSRWSSQSMGTSLKEWSTALADELKVAASRGEPDDGSHYYEHWLAALERLVATKGLSDPGAMLARKEAWADAYRHTQHGKPVELPSTREESPQNKRELVKSSLAKAK